MSKNADFPECLSISKVHLCRHLNAHSPGDVCTECQGNEKKKMLFWGMLHMWGCFLLLEEGRTKAPGLGMGISASSLLLL